MLPVESFQHMMLPGIPASVPSSLSVPAQDPRIVSVLKEGYLLKEPNQRIKAFKDKNVFQKRWFVLKGNKLYSYKDKQEYTKPSETIDLNLCEKVLESNNDEYQNEFILILNKKQRSFVAMSDDEMNEWIKVIQSVLNTQNEEENEPKQRIITLTEEDNFKVYIAIDFGTDGCGLAFALKDRTDITIYNRWRKKKRNIVFKTKTQILLNEKNKLVTFGNDAKKTYIGLYGDENKEYKMFERFKMALYEKNMNKKEKNMDEKEENMDTKKEQKRIDIADELIAVNGQKCSSEIVFVEAFKHLKGEAKKHLKKIIKDKQPNDDEIQWIVTVPAIWGDKAKNKMITWAIKAGLVKTDIKNQCKIVYEPDCAALAIQKEILRLQPAEDKLTVLLKENKLYDLHEKLCDNNMDLETLETLKNNEIDQFCNYFEFDLKEKLKFRKLMKIINNKANDNNNDEKDEKDEYDEKEQNKMNEMSQTRFKNGEKYILVDAGGGTVDVSCHEILGKLVIQEIHHPTGGPWGSTYVDDQYVQLLENIFSKEWMNDFKAAQPNVYVEIIENFQHAKCTFYENSEAERHGCELPDDFIGFLDERCHPHPPEQKVNAAAGKSQDFALVNDTLEINVKKWKTIFDSMLNEIISHIDGLLKLDSLNGCKYLFCVGGFSSSKYFQLRMKNKFGIESRHKLKLIIPSKPMLSVVEGAAYFGLCKDYVKARRLQKTYGIIVLDSIENCKKKGMSDEWIENNQQNGRVERVQVLVHKNQEIKMNQEIQSKTFGHQQMNTTVTILCFEKQNPLYPTDGVKIGKITIYPTEFTDENKDRTIIIAFQFYDTTITVNCYPESNKDAKQRVDLEYV